MFPEKSYYTVNSRRVSAFSIGYRRGYKIRLHLSIINGFANKLIYTT